MKNEPRPRAYIATAAGEHLVVEAVAGDAATSAKDVRIDLRHLPDSTYLALLEMRLVEI
jgi:hypothetical protein